LGNLADIIGSNTIATGFSRIRVVPKVEALMFVVIFEVQPRSGRFEDYLELAKQLKPKLEATDGFIDNERFKSTRNERRVLSLSTWRDEKAVVRWRTHGEHHGVQEKGRSEVFEDYHLRVGEITSDTTPPRGGSVIQTRFDETVVGAAKAATITELTPDEHGTIGAQVEQLAAHLGLASAQRGLIELEAFASIYNAGKLALLVSWRDAEAASTWSPAKPESVASIRHRQVRIIRDYGMFERREAPQFYPDVER
jgi:heme-degrading monooxygenase HmoA